MSRRYASRCYAGGLGPSRVRTSYDSSARPVGVASQNSTLPCAITTFPVSLPLSSPGDVWPRLPLLPSTQPSFYLTEILPVIDSELRPRRRSSGVHLAYTDPSGERQRAPSAPRWGPSGLQGSFRRAIASSVLTCF